MTERLIVNWQDPTSRRYLPVAELLVDVSPGHARYELGYLHGVHRAKEHGFGLFVAFPDLERRYASARLFALFQNRLMPTTRPDYPVYLASLGLSPESATVPELLGRSGGRRQTDNVETVLVPTPQAGQLRTHFLVRGVRHRDGAEQVASSLTPGDALDLNVEPGNPFDPNARQLRVQGALLGYVPAYLTAELVTLAQLGVTPRVTVERVSPAPVPAQHRVLALLEAEWPVGYEPFAGQDFQPIAQRERSAA